MTYFSATDCTSHQLGHRRKQHDHPLHSYGHAHADHFPVHFWETGETGDDEAHGDGNTQRHQGHGPDILLCRQRVRYTDAGFEEDYHKS